MVLRQVGAAVGGVLLCHGGLALFASTWYAAVLGMPWAMAVGTGALFLILLMVAITPEQRRETRASATAFQSGVVVQVVYVTAPAARGLPSGGTSPPDGMPGIVPGEVIEGSAEE